MTAALLAQFDRCRPWLEQALGVGEESTADEVLADLIAGKAQLWPGERCALVTQCVLAPAGPSIHVWLGGGRLREMLAIRPGVEAWGRAMGCIWITGEGRPGWERVLIPLGYVRDGDLLRKAL